MIQISATEAEQVINPDVAAVYGAAFDRQREHSWMQCSWYGHRVQPLTIPGGAPPPAIGWGIGWSGPSALKSSSKDCKLQLALLEQAEAEGQHYACSLSRARFEGLCMDYYVIPRASWKSAARRCRSEERYDLVLVGVST